MKGERTILAYKNYFSDFIGTLTDAEARKANVGGEVLCYVW